MITLTALNDLILDSFEVRKVLVIAPLRVARDTWPSEIKKWDHLKGLTYSVAVGNEPERLAALRERTHIHIINRENVDWLVNKSGVPFDYDMVVIDELSSFKSHQAKRFKSLLKVRPYVKRIVGLTGTPSPNSLMELWAEFRLLDLGKRLGRYITHYRNAYFLPDKRNTECIINETPVHMDAKEYEIYSRFREEMVAKIKDKEIDAANAAALSGKLLQMANGAVYDENHEALHIHNRKLDALEDLIEGANGKPVLVAYWFQHDLERIKSRFMVREIKSSKDITDWNDGKIPVAVIHPASAGHGLNLQAGGSTLVWFSLIWSLELYQQCNARLHRQGQRDTVVIHHIIAKDTIDEDVMETLQKKKKTQNALIDAVKASLGVKS